MKCINCYQEIGNNMFCNYCGTMQPTDREAYEREHPEHAAATGNKDHSPYMPQQAANQSPTPTPSDVTGAAQGASISQNVNAVPQHPVTDNAPSTGNLMQCPDCGSMIPTDSAFCPYCRCPFVAPNQQYHGDPANHSSSNVSSGTSYQVNRDQNFNSQGNQKPKKKGLSGLAITLITLATILLLGVIGGAAYYFFFNNRVTKLRPEDELVEFTRKGGKKTVNIITDAKEIEVAKCPDWVTVTPGDGEITIKCEPLDDYEERDGIIKLKAGDKQAKITVKQSGNATYLNLSQEIIRTGHNSDEVVIEIDTDGDPSSIYYDIDNLFMCSLTERTTSGITVVIEENSSPYPRECNITFRSGKEEKTLTVIQAGCCKYCDGTGKDICLYCIGEGHNNCINCGGLGQEYNFSIDDYVECESCDGRGYVNCDACNGRGYYTCEHCNGTGNNYTQEESILNL